MGKAFVVVGGNELEVSAAEPCHTIQNVQSQKAPKPIELSIIIPTLNAASTLKETLYALGEIQETMTVEIIVADGGSTDATVALAQACGARVVNSARGRGVQLSAGAKEAKGNWLLFVHADTTLEPFWSTTVFSFVRNKANAMRAAHFTFALDDASNAARRIEVLANWRSRRLGLPYGDQGLLMSRRLYHSLVGFLDIPIMEDVDMVRRIGRKNLIELPATATTSSVRYRKDGFWLRPLRNLALLTLYFMGASPQWLARRYG